MPPKETADESAKVRVAICISEWTGIDCDLHQEKVEEYARVENTMAWGEALLPAGA
jgi:hypothetical protein